MDIWRTRKFRALHTEWNKKLELSGFTDHEIEINGDRVLKQHASNAYRQADPLERRTRLEYFLFIGSLIHETQFPNFSEKYIMLRHSEGATIQETTSELTIIGLKQSRKTIGRIIRRWQMKWGVRSWSLKQLHLKK